jgi:glycosyltransferase involved in cell wall biosynthesis
MDIVKAGLKAGLDIQWFDRIFPAHEIRQAGDSVIVFMPVDPQYTTPYILLVRDLKRGGVKGVYYGVTEGKLDRRPLRPWMREADFIAVSNYVRDKLIEAGLRVIDVVHHGIDLERVEEAKRTPGAGLSYLKNHGLDPSKDVIVLTIANSHPRKGLAWYDNVVEEVGKKDGSIKFLVITEEKGLSYFKRRPNLVVTADFGKLPRLTVLSLIANSHVLAIPSFAEGFGLPVLEAMALGTPTVHAALPPLMEFSTGFVVPVEGISYLDNSPAGPSGIIYEEHLWEPIKFAEVLLQVVDLVRNKREAIEDWRARSAEVARKMDIHNCYPRLLKYVS